MKKVKFLDFDCIVDDSETYQNGATVVRLIEDNTFEYVATATVNVIEGLIKDNEVVIKDYSENTGMLNALIDAGVVSQPLRYIPLSQWISAPVCKLI
jgi:hypothetical protein